MIGDNTIKNKLIDVVLDQKLIEFFYLDKTTEEVSEKLMNLKLEIFKDNSSIPFNACVKGYSGAKDNEGNVWLIKKVSEKEKLIYRLCELGYLLDFEFQTLTAPSILTKINSDYYRATKVVLNSEGVSGYDYLKNPMLNVLINDLINRWLVFDEDRNPNNYLVIQNSKREPIIVAIDNGNQDLLAENMKITGNDEQFGWFRQEKTRFLTLLKPSHFHSASIEDIEERLSLMMNFSEERIRNICFKLLENIVGDPEEKTELVVSNILKRRKYVNEYFRKWFKKRDNNSAQKSNSEYELFGKTFMDMYKN